VSAQYSSVGMTCFQVFSHQTWWSSRARLSVRSSGGITVSWLSTTWTTSLTNCTQTQALSTVLQTKHSLNTGSKWLLYNIAVQIPTHIPLFCLSRKHCSVYHANTALNSQTFISTDRVAQLQCIWGSFYVCYRTTQRGSQEQLTFLPKQLVSFFFIEVINF